MQNELVEMCGDDDLGVRIPLSNGGNALVSREDESAIRQFSWYKLKARSAFYAARRNPRGVYPRVVLMHRELLQADGLHQVDHKNHITLDNRRCNLRLATASENAANRRRFVDSGQGGAEKKQRGIYRHGRGWRAEIKQDNKYIYLGTHDTAYLAMQAYNEAALRLYGEFAQLNDLRGARELDGSGPESV